MRNRTDIRYHTFAEDEQFFIDANIWFFIYGPLPTRNVSSEVYSRALKKMRASGSRVFVNVLVLSEFINRFARFEFHRCGFTHGTGDFKRFRDSDEFEEISEEIAIMARRIAESAIRCDSGFHRFDVFGILDEFRKTRHDFNDLMIAKLCEVEGFTLVTHDSDFANDDIPLLTANDHLLGMRE
jgi:predicted nucleic acid-binding protein